MKRRSLKLVKYGVVVTAFIIILFGIVDPFLTKEVYDTMYWYVNETLYITLGVFAAGVMMYHKFLLV